MTPQNDALKWYLVQCKPREHERALENLERQCFECFRPTRVTEKRRGTQKRTVKEPLFPGYLFIRLDRLHDNWHSIRATRGVNQIVRFNEYPLPVRDEVIEDIRARITAPVSGETALFKSGERLEISSGPFSHLEEIFVSNDGDERVVLLLNILQQEQRLSFPVGVCGRWGDRKKEVKDVPEAGLRGSK